MRALVFSDLHDDEAALEKLAGMRDKFDRVFICGDSASTEWFAKRVFDAFPDALIIPGNNENAHLNGLIAQMPGFVHGKTVPIDNGIWVAGFGYSNPTPFGTYGEMDDDEIYSGLSKMDIGKDTILLLHAPPFGHFDSVSGDVHVGSRSIMRIISEKNPMAAFFGHVHEHSGISVVGSTTLVKVPPAYSMKAVSAEITNKKVIPRIISL
jgi:hypothetical protein